jgi:hypothetical protein
MNGAEKGNGFRPLARLWLVAFAIWLPPSIAVAQVPPPPVQSTVDENSVDLTTGRILVGRTDVAIGPNNHHGLGFSRQWVDSGWRALSEQMHRLVRR